VPLANALVAGLHLGRVELIEVRVVRGLVAHRRLPGAPPGVEYRLTELGETLLEPVRTLSRWAEEHAEELGHQEVPYGSAPSR
jgi:DNA-binding HxlR family transcriptional regulator